MKKGVDAPLIPILFIIAGIVTTVSAWQSRNPANFIFPLIMFVLAIVFLHTSLFGKYRIIRNVVDSLNIAPDSEILDLGTGHGAVLLAVARKLKSPGEVVAYLF